MTEASARFSLPFILAGQAQKELFHNEALARVDALLHAAVEGVAAAPPAAPAVGACWIVGAGAAGEWAGQADAIAAWTDGGWRFIAPKPGTRVWNQAQGLWIHWNGAGWSDGSLPASSIRIGGEKVVGARQPAIASPSNGTIIDAEGRAAITQIIVALRTHGMIH